MNNCLIQVTNPSIGAVALNGAIPLGLVTLNANCNCGQNQTLVAQAVSNVSQIEINRSGKFELSYLPSVTAAAAGTVTINLVVNGVTINSISAAVGAGTATVIPLNYIIQVSNVPTVVKFVVTGSALTGGTSNLVVRQL